MELPEYFRVINQIDGTNHVLLFNEVDNSLCLLKTLKYYDLRVFNYLKTNNNPHIPKVLLFEEENGKLSVIEEYVDGYTLEEYLSINSTLSADKKFNIINQLCDGLEFLHKAPTPIIHRDLKPSNIMIDKSEVIKLIDYDAAKTYKQGASRDTYLIGSNGTAAPEQYGFAQSDPRTDIFALGKFLEVLFKDTINTKHKWIKKVVKKATSLDPKDRYQNITEFKDGMKSRGREHSFLPFPGFRTKHPAKITVALIAYTMITILLSMFYSLIMDLPNNNVLNTAYFLMVVVYFYSLIDLFTDWSGLFSNLPLMKGKSLGNRIPFAFIYSIPLTLIFRVISHILRALLYNLNE